MKKEGDVMRMRDLQKGLEIPAGGTVTLRAGSFHLMLEASISC
jgi:copper(I)-binding protein